MINLYTGRVCFQRRYQRMGIPFINTTVKMGVKAFAPTWDMVLGVKGKSDDVITEEEYTKRYMELMDESWDKNPEVWEDLYSRTGDLIITCFCPTNRFCHRHLLAAYILTRASERNAEVNLKGEYPIEPPTF